MKIEGLRILEKYHQQVTDFFAYLCKEFQRTGPVIYPQDNPPGDTSEIYFSELSRLGLIEVKRTPGDLTKGFIPTVELDSPTITIISPTKKGLEKYLSENPPSSAPDKDLELTN